MVDIYWYVYLVIIGVNFFGDILGFFFLREVFDVVLLLLLLFILLLFFRMIINIKFCF